MTTIAYDQPVKDYIDELNATGHVTHRSYNKKSVTLHHNAGRLSHEGVLSVWKTRPASAHFDVDGQGRVCQYVKVNEYAWHAGSTVGNQESIGIEMANSSTAPNWGVADATWKAAARLAGWLFAKVIKARPSSSNLFMHSHWRATACAGPFIKSIWGKVVAEVTKWYNYFTASKPATTPSKPAPAPAPARKSNDQIANEVIANKWGNGADRVARLKRAGYNPATIQSLVNQKLSGKKPAPAPARKSNTQIAREVIAGKWGNGPDRMARLKRAGYNASAVQAEVNRLL
jgi:hypothetical protein